jgi:hypothetical protein
VSPSTYTENNRRKSILTTREMSKEVQITPEECVNRVVAIVITSAFILAGFTIVIKLSKVMIADLKEMGL